MITGENVKAARELLGWSIAKLADEAALAQSVLKLFEIGQSRLAAVHVDVLRDVLKGARVEFTNGRPGHQAEKGQMMRPLSRTNAATRFMGDGPRKRE
jgi:transcriptional regulator with XRE-family HTH domain